MPGEHAPRFTVIVPSRDRPRALERCLEALARLDYPRPDWEVVVVDNGGGQPLSGLLARFSSRLRATLVWECRTGAAAARNAGAAAARGELLAFTDDDCEPAPGWLARLERVLADVPGAVVGGSIVNALPANTYAVASQVVMDAVYRHYNAKRGAARFFATNNLALPAALFRELGGFDTSFPGAGGEDREFSDRCELAGVPMIYAPEAVVAHAHDLTLRRLWRQHCNYGRGTAVFRSAREARGGDRLRIEPDLHATLLRTAVGSRSPGGRVRVLAAVLLTQVAYVAGFIRGRLSRPLQQRQAPQHESRAA